MSVHGENMIAFKDGRTESIYVITPQIYEEMLLCVDDAMLTDGERAQAKTILSEYVPFWNAHCGKPTS